MFSKNQCPPNLFVISEHAISHELANSMFASSLVGCRLHNSLLVFLFAACHTLFQCRSCTYLLSSWLYSRSLILFVSASFSPTSDWLFLTWIDCMFLPTVLRRCRLSTICFSNSLSVLMSMSVGFVLHFPLQKLFVTSCLSSPSLHIPLHKCFNPCKSTVEPKLSSIIDIACSLLCRFINFVLASSMSSCGFSSTCFFSSFAALCPNFESSQMSGVM